MGKWSIPRDTWMIGAAMSDGEQPRRWRKSSFGNSGDCLEWMVDPDEVRLHDPTKGSSVELQLSPGEWRAFLTAGEAGEADLLEE
jgi:Domain of unknown function (DUF397)